MNLGKTLESEREIHNQLLSKAEQVNIEMTAQFNACPRKACQYFSKKANFVFFSSIFLIFCAFFSNFHIFPSKSFSFIDFLFFDF